MIKCTNFGCEEEARYFDKYHTEIALCYSHATAYFDAFGVWLWRGTPDALSKWLAAFNESGGKLK